MMELFSDTIPIWNDSCKMLTKEMLPFPGLHMIGYAQYSSSIMHLPNHYHETKEFTIIMNGTQDYYVGEEIFTLHGRDIFMTHPYEGHGNNGYPQAICEYVWFQLDIDNSNGEKFLGLPDPFDQYVYQQVSNYDIRVGKAGTDDLSQLKKAFFCLASGEISQQLLGHSILIQFIVKNFCDIPVSVAGSVYNPQVQKAIGYIQEHFREALTVDLIADYVRLSVPRFIHNFKSQVGITPHAYILSLKINEAKIMLRNCDIPIIDISNELNFSSSNHFAAAFKKHTGYSPTQFRKLTGGKND